MALAPVPIVLQVARASDFAVAQTFEAGWGYGSMLRWCPNCGECGPTRHFQVVREHHP